MSLLIPAWWFFWIGGAVVVGIVANQRRNRSGFGWFILSLLISPLLAGLLVLALQPSERYFLPREPMIERKTRDRALIVFAMLAIAAIVIVIVAMSQASAQSRSFFDRNGSFAGSSTMSGNSTSLSDRNGRFDGTAIRNSDGSTSVYDRNGHFTGSSSSQGTASNPLTGGRR